MAIVTLTGRGAQKVHVQTGLFINNEFHPSIKGSALDTYNPYSGDLLATISAAEDVDIDRAVEAAHKAFYSEWRSVPGIARSALMNKLADLIDLNADDLAALHALDGGFVYDDVKAIDISVASSVLRHFAGWADKISGRVIDIPGGTGYTRPEPIGVCGMIVPWNAPLMITCWKLAPAIASGNVVVIKTPELAPLVGQKLAELVLGAGFPPGVINIVNGLGTTAGKAIAEHMKIWKVSFTGSTQTGRAILQAASRSNLKKVSLELGGKGPSIIFKDADITNAVSWTSLGSSSNNGQVCALGSRIYVQEDIYDDFLKKFQDHANMHPGKAGNPLEKGITKGPIINKKQHERVMSYIKIGEEEGARLVRGGRDLKVHTQPKTEHVSGFIENTIFTNVTEDMTIVKEEIFGPLATIHRFTTEAEVIEKANGSLYGLSASVFSSNIDCISRVSNALECGQVCVNCWGTLSPNMPFGGTKESGFGRDMGEESIEAWTNLKSVYHLNLSGDII